MGTSNIVTRLVLASQFAWRTPVILFVDNKAAQSSLIAGPGESGAADQICAAFWAYAALAGVNVWARYSPSKLNIADAPLRARNVPRGDNETTTALPNASLPGS